ncbi:MAG TPA: polymer-forming cytoskeletal protein [Pyrinomonadaceae bacterium]
MIRMGRGSKPEQEESDHSMDTSESQPNTLYPSSSYQNNEAQHRQTADPASASRAISESESLARDIKDGILSGYVGNGTILTGEATFKAMLRVDGHLSGTVSSESGTLIVGNNGQVDADVKVAVATIHGAVNGDIVASQRLELGRAARVKGNIESPSLVIEQGAVFEGSCRMIQVKADQEKARESMTRGTSSRSSDVLDTSSMQPVSDESSTTTDYSDISDVAS